MQVNGQLSASPAAWANKNCRAFQSVSDGRQAEQTISAVPSELKASHEPLPNVENVGLWSNIPSG
jgi:hypothetical protein